jgi:hypothetical protein
MPQSLMLKLLTLVDLQPLLEEDSLTSTSSKTLSTLKIILPSMSAVKALIVLLTALDVIVLNGTPLKSSQTTLFPLLTFLAATVSALFQ